MFNATLRKDGIPINLFTNKDERFDLLIDLLHELKSLKELKNVSNDSDFSNDIFANIETSRTLYQIQLGINPANYNIQMVQMSAGGKLFKYYKYYEPSEKSKSLVKKIFLTSNPKVIKIKVLMFDVVEDPFWREVVLKQVNKMLKCRNLKQGYMSACYTPLVDRREECVTD